MYLFKIYLVVIDNYYKFMVSFLKFSSCQVFFPLELLLVYLTMFLK